MGTVAFSAESHILAYDNEVLFQVDQEMGELLKEVGINWVSYGPGDSYILEDAEGGLHWYELPDRAVQLLKTRSQYELAWASLGTGGSYFLLFRDGAFYWGGSGIPVALDKT